MSLQDGDIVYIAARDTEFYYTGGLVAVAFQGFTLQDYAAEDEFGRSLAAGDFNGDGFDELAVGIPYEDSVLFMDAFTPTLEGWQEVDDRIANCVLFEVDESQTEIIQSTSSLRNSGM